MSSGQPVVNSGSFCPLPGAKGATTTGTPMACQVASDGRHRWKRDPDFPAPPRKARPGRRVRTATHSAVAVMPAQPPLLPLPYVAAVTLPAAAPAEELPEIDRRILAFEAKTWPSPGAKESAIGREFQMSGIRYYQQLNRLLDDSRALAAYPQMINRLRRIREGRTRR